MISERVRQRFLQDPLPTRLGGLAADVARIASFSGNPENRQAVASLLEEGKYFAEWMAQDAPLETQAVLAEVQIALALWERGWLRHAPMPTMRTEAARRSEELLELAGLYNLLEVSEGLAKQLGPKSRGLARVLNDIRLAVASKDPETLSDHLAPLRVGEIFRPHADAIALEEPCRHQDRMIPHDVVVWSGETRVVNEVKRVRDDTRWGLRELIDLVRNDAGPQLCTGAKNIVWVETFANEHVGRWDVEDVPWFECGGHLLRPEDQRDPDYVKLDDLSGVGWLHGTSVTTAQPSVSLMREDPDLRSLLEQCGVIVKTMNIGVR